MENEKKWYASKGIWGSAVAIGAGLAGTIWGVNITEADQATIVSAITAIGGAIGGIIALYGRIKADGKIK